MCYACVDEILHTILLHCTNIAPSKMMFLHNYCKAHDLIFIFNTSKRFEKKGRPLLKRFFNLQKKCKKNATRFSYNISAKYQRKPYWSLWEFFFIYKIKEWLHQNREYRNVIFLKEKEIISQRIRTCLTCNISACHNRLREMIT